MKERKRNKRKRGKKERRNEGRRKRETLLSFSKDEGWRKFIRKEGRGGRVSERESE